MALGKSAVTYTSAGFIHVLELALLFSRPGSFEAILFLSEADGMASNSGRSFSSSTSKMELQGG